MECFEVKGKTLGPPSDEENDGQIGDGSTQGAGLGDPFP